MDLPYEKRFHFHDGSSVGSVEELRDRLQRISYEEFYRHVNVEKNDFASWIRYTLHEETLAQDLEKVSSIVETIELLSDFLIPRSGLGGQGDVQTRIEEELNIHFPMEEAAAPTAQSQMFDAHEIEEELASAEQEQRKRPTQAVRFNAEPPGPMPGALTLSEHEYSRLIVKDFMYGLMFGLLLGLILGKILTF